MKIWSGCWRGDGLLVEWNIDQECTIRKFLFRLEGRRSFIVLGQNMKKLSMGSTRLRDWTQIPQGVNGYGSTTTWCNRLGLDPDLFLLTRLVQGHFALDSRQMPIAELVSTFCL